ncbi:MAG TPA: M23 family metallopeptidase, partial [Candidatus Dormibacteraeota bacterium]
ARLVDIARRLDGEAVLLSAQEWEIRRLAAVTGRHRDDPDQLPVGAATGPAERSRLAALLGAHGAGAGAYHRDLEAEYDLYRTAASDTAQRAELMSGAATLRSPDAPVAVAADLDLLTTQVAQETAVAEAQARLRRLAALLPTQVAAIRHHRPFLTPEVAPVSQDFGPTDLGIEPPLTYKGTFYPHFHTGIDLAADEGTPLHAAADGVVVLATSSVDAAGRLTGYGNYVVIGHAAGFLTLYGHLSEIAVHDGDRVRQGQVIGLEGSTGNSTGPHVHFEIRRDGALLDPAPFLAGQLPAS